jgi:hypothetical protein
MIVEVTYLYPIDLGKDTSVEKAVKHSTKTYKIPQPFGWGGKQGRRGRTVGSTCIGNTTEMLF